MTQDFCKLNGCIIPDHDKYADKPVGNRVISYSLRVIELFLKVPVIIIIRFGENNVLGTIYIVIH